MHFKHNFFKFIFYFLKVWKMTRSGIFHTFFLTGSLTDITTLRPKSYLVDVCTVALNIKSTKILFST